MLSPFMLGTIVTLIIILCHDCHYIWGNGNYFRTRLPTMVAHALWQISCQIEYYQLPCSVMQPACVLLQSCNQLNSHPPTTLPNCTLSLKGAITSVPGRVLHHSQRLQCCDVNNFPRLGRTLNCSWSVPHTGDSSIYLWYKSSGDGTVLPIRPTFGPLPRQFAMQLSFWPVSIKLMQFVILP